MKTRLILKGSIQDSPDTWGKYHQTIVIESKEVYAAIEAGYQVVGSENLKEQTEKK